VRAAKSWASDRRVLGAVADGALLLALADGEPCWADGALLLALADGEPCWADGALLLALADGFDADEFPDIVCCSGVFLTASA